ncbi:MAG TPA: SDR family NAD(P)-dependent oxidoreductase [Roseiarcus sp.]
MRRVAMITGASRGIGAVAALLLAERGFRVVVNHRASAPQAEEVVAAIIRPVVAPSRFRRDV